MMEARSQFDLIQSVLDRSEPFRREAVQALVSAHEADRALSKHTFCKDELDELRRAPDELRRAPDEGLAPPYGTRVLDGRLEVQVDFYVVLERYPEVISMLCNLARKHEQRV